MAALLSTPSIRRCESSFAFVPSGNDGGTLQGELFKGAVLLAPMLSLEKLSKTGWNPYLRSHTYLFDRFIN